MAGPTVWQIGIGATVRRPAAPAHVDRIRWPAGASDSAGLTEGERNATFDAMVIIGMDEQTQLSEVVDRLVLRYPTLAPATITEVVEELHARFNGARIREFVPLFVERRADTALAELDVSYA